MKNKKGFKDSKGYNSWLKVAAWAPIASVVLAILFAIITQIVISILGAETNLVFLNILNSGIAFILGGLFIFGFYKIGKKYNSKLMRIIAILIIVVAFVALVVQYSYFQSAVTGLTGGVSNKLVELGLDNESNLSEVQVKEAYGLLFTQLGQDATFMNNFYVIMVLFLSYMIVLGVLNIILGIALIKLNEKIKFAKTTGILLIVGVVTSIILIGFIVLLAAWIMQIIVLFKEAYKK